MFDKRVEFKRILYMSCKIIRINHEINETSVSVRMFLLELYILFELGLFY